MYEWAELIKLWEHNQVTPEQVIGQLLKHGEAQQAQLTALQRRLAKVEQTPAAGTETLPTPAAGKPSAVRR